MNELRIPLAALPGFDPVGLKVRSSLLAPALDLSGLYVTPLDCHEHAIHWCSDDAPEPWPEDRVVLDLADSATRDRVARWVAGRLDYGDRHNGLWWHFCDGRWWLTGPNDEPSPSFVADQEGLADLDPADPTLLPDGSRQVDAMALGRVAVHLGSQP